LQWGCCEEILLQRVGSKRRDGQPSGSAWFLDHGNHVSSQCEVPLDQRRRQRRWRKLEPDGNS